MAEDERESEGVPLPVLLTEGLTVWDLVMEGEGVAEVERHTLAVRVSFPTEPEAHMVGEDVRDTVDVGVGAGVVAPGVAETVEVTEAARAVAVPCPLLKEGLLEPHFDTVGLREGKGEAETVVVNETEGVEVEVEEDVVVTEGVEEAEALRLPLRVAEAQRELVTEVEMVREVEMEREGDTVAVDEMGIHFTALGTYVWFKAQRG